MGKYLDPKADLAEPLESPESAYNEGQLEAYDRFWDAVYRERVFYDDGYKKGQAVGWADGRAVGIEEGRAEGMAAGQAEGADKTNRDHAQKMKAKGFAVEDIAEITGLTIEVINSL